ncbi:hypothetical protein B0J18DRAFT_425554 [Chaetomium sp. MPI-SDFR-AT-0129]|nr:hypothetical protein B0J18DRAFT_425554 [Chaetomium sp. MPI-SDFR-AT-0129]
MASNPPEHFPPARVIPPLNPPHRQTIILLHGRGLSWSTFGVDLLSTEFHAFYPLDPATASVIEGEGNLKQRVVPLRTLQTRYPHAKFIFPLAPRGRATIYARSMIHQWFDGWHLAPPVSPESGDESSEDDLLESSSEVYAGSDIGTNSEYGFEPNSGAQTQSQKAHMHQNQHQHHQKHDKQQLLLE